MQVTRFENDFPALASLTFILGLPGSPESHLFNGWISIKDLGRCIDTSCAHEDYPSRSRPEGAVCITTQVQGAMSTRIRLG